MKNKKKHPIQNALLFIMISSSLGMAVTVLFTLFALLDSGGVRIIEPNKTIVVIEILLALMGTFFNVMAFWLFVTLATKGEM